MQAQDYESGLWSLGVRLPLSSRVEVESALTTAKIVRTWPQRGTIHLVPGEDARWMVEHLGAPMLAERSLGPRWRHLGLEATIANRAVDVLAAALAGQRLTRAGCLSALAGAGISTEGQRGYHLLWYAAAKGVVVIGPHVDGEQTFALLDDLAPTQVTMDADSALSTMVRRYLQSHGPATMKDIVGWLGSTARAIKPILADLSEVNSEPVEWPEGRARTVFWLQSAAPTSPGPSDDTELWPMPGFDEFMLGYKERELHLSSSDVNRVVPGRNGVFRPTVAQGGCAVAVWRPAYERGWRVGPSLANPVVEPLGSGPHGGVPTTPNWQIYRDFFGPN
jgi:hypothetical protein